MFDIIGIFLAIKSSSRVISNGRPKEIRHRHSPPVCAVHSTANAYKDLCKSVPEIDHVYLFSRSRKRTNELEKVAKVEGLTVRRFPKYFEVRWAEFTAALLDAIMCSWQALIKFNVEQCDAEGKKVSESSYQQGQPSFDVFCCRPAFLNQSVPKEASKRLTNNCGH